MSRGLVMETAEKFQFDKSRTHLLLSELEQAQQNQVYQITAQDLKRIQAAKRIRHLKKFSSEKVWVVGLVLQWVASDETLGRLLQLDRASHAALKRQVYKQALLVS